MENGNRPVTGYMRKPSMDELRQYAQCKDVWVKGMTKREAFAMAAMQGILASAPRDDMGSNFIADWSLDCADELLKALENNNAD